MTRRHLVLSLGLGLTPFSVVVRGQTKTEKVVLEVDGLVWAECSHSVESALEELDGVASVDVNLNIGEVAVEIDSKKVKPNKLVEVVNNTCDTAHCFTAKLKEK